MAVTTGLRLGEILALKPKDIENNILRVSHSFNIDDGLKSTKNGKTRIVPLDDKLVIFLTEFCKEKQQEDFLFSKKSGKGPIDHKAIYKRFYKALELIGIDKESRIKRNISFHSYRHYMNTQLLQSGLHPETVRLILGHCSPAMTAHYSHIQQLPDFEMQRRTNTCNVSKYSISTTSP